jgi:predicted HTH transcriptional regulator
MNEIQPSLNFKYPNRPGYRNRSTSEDAADAIAPQAESLRNKCYRMLQAKPMTADECAEMLGESPFTIRPRITELAKQNKIVDSGERRVNRSMRKAIVWRVSPTRT